MTTTKHDTDLAKIDAELAALAEHENLDALLRDADSHHSTVKEALAGARIKSAQAQSILGELEQYARECPRQIDEARFSADRLLALDLEDEPSEREIAKLLSLSETVSALRYFLTVVDGKTASLRQRFAETQKAIGSLGTEEKAAAAELARLKAIHAELVKSAKCAAENAAATAS